MSIILDGMCVKFIFINLKAGEVMNSQKTQSANPSGLAVGKEFLLTIKRIGINGEGIGYYKRQVVFVPNTLPDEEVIVRATKVERGYAEAELVRIRKKSPHRVEPPCPIYKECGGCTLQHVDYEEQLKYKRDLVLGALDKYCRLPVEKFTVRKTIGMKNPWSYRNKSQLQVSNRDNILSVGLYKENTHDVVDLSRCLVQRKELNEVVQVMKKLIKKYDISIYNEKKHKGWLKTIVTRVAIKTGEIQLVFVTLNDEFPHRDELVADIRKRLPNVESIMQNVNDKKTSLIFGEDTKCISGSSVIEERLGDLTFELSPRAFFQLNPEQTVTLYNEVKKAARLTGEEYVVDAYCGVGTIGMWLANDAAEVRGMDMIPEAIEDARENAEINGFNNLRYITGKAEVILPRWKKEDFVPDVVVVDPPRIGLDDELMRTLLQLRPHKIVYVSCNPSTLAKDLEVLGKLYHASYIQPVDMFPQTSQVETVTLLQLRKYFKDGN